MADRDTWAQYTAAIRAEFQDTREAANAQLKLSQLRYKGNVKVYFTEFRTVNVYAQATGEGLRQKIDQAIPDSILDMHFAHYMEEFIDDEHFLMATYNAGLHMEQRKALKAACEAQPGNGGGRKDGPDGKNPGNIRKGTESGGPKQAGKPDSGARLKSQGKHGQKATGEAVATPTRGFPRMKSTPTGTAKQVAGGVDETATPLRTAMPVHRSRVWSYQKPRTRQAQIRGKGKGGGMLRRLRPTSKPHQEKKSASRRTGCVRTHQALGTLWTHPGRAHAAPNAKRTGNVNLDAARHGTMHSDAVCQGTMRPDAARHGIRCPDAVGTASAYGTGPVRAFFFLDAALSGHFLQDGACQGIFLLDAAVSGHFLLDAAVSGHFPSGRSCVRAFPTRHSRVRAFSFRTQPCQGKWRLDDACHGTAVTLAVKAQNIAANTLVAFANTQLVPGIVTQYSSILYI